MVGMVMYAKIQKLIPTIVAVTPTPVMLSPVTGIWSGNPVKKFVGSHVQNWIKCLHAPVVLTPLGPKA
jgi:hypothetical protein